MFQLNNNRKKYSEIGYIKSILNKIKIIIVSRIYKVRNRKSKFLLIRQFILGKR